jgi:hypothetical protein
VSDAKGVRATHDSLPRGQRSPIQLPCVFPPFASRTCRLARIYDASIRIRHLTQPAGTVLSEDRLAVCCSATAPLSKPYDTRAEPDLSYNALMLPSRLISGHATWLDSRNGERLDERIYGANCARRSVRRTLKNAKDSASAAQICQSGNVCQP